MVAKKKYPDTEEGRAQKKAAVKEQKKKSAARIRKEKKEKVNMSKEDTPAPQAKQTAKETHTMPDGTEMAGATHGVSVSETSQTSENVKLPLFGASKLLVPEWFIMPYGKQGKWKLVSPTSKQRNISTRKKLKSLQLIQKKGLGHVVMINEDEQVPLMKFSLGDRKRIREHMAETKSHKDKSPINKPDLHKPKGKERGRPESLPENMRVNRSRGKKANLDIKVYSNKYDSESGSDDEPPPPKKGKKTGKKMKLQAAKKAPAPKKTAGRVRKYPDTEEGRAAKKQAKKEQTAASNKKKRAERAAEKKKKIESGEIAKKKLGRPNKRRRVMNVVEDDFDSEDDSGRAGRWIDGRWYKGGELVYRNGQFDLIATLVKNAEVGSASDSSDDESGSGFKNKVIGGNIFTKIKKGANKAIKVVSRPIGKTINKVADTIDESVIKPLANVAEEVGERAGNVVEKIFYKDHNLPMAMKALMEQFGHQTITKAVLKRTPVSGLITGALNVFSMGKFGRRMKPFDELFHLFIELRLEKGTEMRLEKNARITLSKAGSVDKEGTESDPIDATELPSGLNLDLIIDRTRNYMGDDKFYGYSAANNNCQDFIIAVLTSNKIGDAANKTWVKQNTENLFKGKKMKGLKKFSHGVTEFGQKLESVGDAIMGGALDDDDDDDKENMGGWRIDENLMFHIPNIYNPLTAIPPPNIPLNENYLFYRNRQQAERYIAEIARERDRNDEWRPAYEAQIQAVIENYESSSTEDFRHPDYMETLMTIGDEALNREADILREEWAEDSQSLSTVEYEDEYNEDEYNDEDEYGTDDELVGIEEMEGGAIGQVSPDQRNARRSLMAQLDAAADAEFAAQQPNHQPPPPPPAPHQHDGIIPPMMPMLQAAAAPQQPPQPPPPRVVTPSPPPSPQPPAQGGRLTSGRGIKHSHNLKMKGRGYSGLGDKGGYGSQGAGIGEEVKKHDFWEAIHQSQIEGGYDAAARQMARQHQVEEAYDLATKAARGELNSMYSMSGSGVKDGDEIDWDDIKWGSFTAMFKKFKRSNPHNKKVKDLKDFAEMINGDSNKYSKAAAKKANFYLNVLSKK